MFFSDNIYVSYLCLSLILFSALIGRDGSKITTVVATPGQGTDRVQEVSYTDTKVIGNGSFGVVFQAKLCDTGELVAIKKVLQDRRFKVSSSICELESQIYIHILTLNLHLCFFFLQNRELQIMRRLEHCNIVKLLYFFYSSGEKVIYMTFIYGYLTEFTTIRVEGSQL